MAGKQHKDVMKAIRRMKVGTMEDKIVNICKKVWLFARFFVLLQPKHE